MTPDEAKEKLDHARQLMESAVGAQRPGDPVDASFRLLFAAASELVYTLADLIEEQAYQRVWVNPGIETRLSDPENEERHPRSGMKPDAGPDDNEGKR